MKVLDLFSGVAGFSLAARNVGWETVGFCEIDPYCQRLLAKNFPGVPINEDITSFKPRQNVDMVTAGFPCQDVSLAGDGAGLSGDRSGLFWYILRTIRLVGRPKLLLENVAALLTRGMGTVLGALAQIGYDTEWHCIPASAIGCIQNRDRVWIIANPASDGMQRFLTSEDISPIGQRWACGQEDLQQVYANPFGGNGWPEPLLRGSDQRLPNWSHRLKGLGNSIVPQIAEIIFRAIGAKQ